MNTGQKYAEVKTGLIAGLTVETTHSHVHTHTHTPSLALAVCLPHSHTDTNTIKAADTKQIKILLTSLLVTITNLLASQIYHLKKLIES